MAAGTPKGHTEQAKNLVPQSRDEAEFKPTGHRLLADTEITENRVQDVLNIDPASKPAQRPGGQAQLLGDQVVLPGHVAIESPTESFLCPLKGVAMPLAADQGLLTASQMAPGIGGKGVQ